jgi:F-type H+-transporting ATPase subunit gamma
LATLREIRRRIRSVRNIAKVTRAMEMVAAAKMRRAQNQVLAMRPYAEKARDILAHLAAQRGVGEDAHPLFVSRPVSRIGVVLITSNKGLCGGYNHNLIRRVDEFLDGVEWPVDLITVGRVGRGAMLRTGQNIIADFEHIPDQPTFLDIASVTRIVMDDFLAGKLDEVYLAYTEFINTMVQIPRIERLLPLQRIGPATETPLPEQAGPLVEFIYEPNPREILNAVVPRFTEVQVYEAFLEARASEQSARMVAMRAATDNANELIGDLTLSYNQARQNAITKEMLDIVGGVEALAAARKS